MKFRLFVLSIVCFAMFASCSQNVKNNYAIRDFSKTLQPYLTEVVSQGIVGYDPATAFIEKNATDKELKHLSQCEHPVLRALAFREMLKRPTFDHFDLMMTNLDDTAIVATDAGEWGVEYRRVSDDMLIHGKWKDTAARRKTIEEIILKHNFLTGAYRRAGWVAPNEKFYASIKQMVQQKRGMYDNYDQIENALFALAAYKKAEDIPLIKEKLSSLSAYLGGTSFELMSTFPNDAYMEVCEGYYRRTFYRTILEDWPTFPDIGLAFAKSVAVYKNKKAEKILDSIFNKKPFMPCPVDTSWFRRELVNAIWNNPCPAYEQLRKQAAPYMKRYKEEEKRAGDGLPLDDVNAEIHKDTTKEPVQWY